MGPGYSVSGNRLLASMVKKALPIRSRWQCRFAAVESPHCTVRVIVVEAWDAPLVPVIVTL